MRKPSAQIQVLICAEFREKKGIELGIRAFGRAIDGKPVDCRLHIIGDGSGRHRIEAAIEESGLGERVTLAGRQPYNKVLEALRDSHLLLQPSLTAADGDAEGGAPVILLDAQASGLPVVSTVHGDIPEYVLDGESGYLAPEGDVDGLTEQLRRCLFAPDAWERLGRSGRRHVEENYNARSQAAALEEIYDKLC